MSIVKKFSLDLLRNDVLKDGSSVGVALSGGVDSMVLLRLFSSAFPGADIHAITVDHKLRSESTLEAQKVGQMIADMENVKHTILTISRKINRNQLEKDARDFRYDLINRYCCENQIKHLLVAHHLDDQLETVAMRLHQHSSVFGLKGIKPVTPMRDINLVRPMLGLTKEDIYRHARQENIQWVEDPSNQDKDITLRNYFRYHIKNDPNLKSSLIETHEMVDQFLSSVNKSINQLQQESSIHHNSRLGSLLIKIPLNVSNKYHDIVLNRFLYEQISIVSPDPKYQYKFRKFDSSNTGLLDGNFSLIDNLREERLTQIAHCIIEANISDSSLLITARRQPEESKSITECSIHQGTLLNFDNRFQFVFNTEAFNNMKIVHYNYKLHYKSLDDKAMNKLASKYQLPVIVNSENEVITFPTLDERNDNAIKWNPMNKHARTSIKI